MNGGKKKVCLITPNHISTNPRLVKEAIALESAGFDVHIIFTQSLPFETALDNALLSEHPQWKFDALNWSGKGLFPFGFRFLFGLTQKLSGKLYSLTKREWFAYLFTNRNFFWQLNKAVSAKADLYIAHNLGALPVARKAARRLNVKFGFDAEDFHRNEVSDNPLDKDVTIKAVVEENNLHDLEHFTAASPLIGSAYSHLFPKLIPTVVLNVFPKINMLHKKESSTTKLKLFWFSQTIGENRGIEPIINAMGELERESYELHLLGNPLPDFKCQIEAAATALGIKNQLFFHEPVPEKQIFQLASCFDIGLASETGVPYNRDICLTNKIFTYIQSGLAVVASDTTAQVEFFECYPMVGQLYKRNSVSSLAAILEHYHQNRNELKICKAYNRNLGRSEMNWEGEQGKFINCIRSVLSDAK